MYTWYTRILTFVTVLSFVPLSLMAMDEPKEVGDQFIAALKENNIEKISDLLRHDINVDTTNALGYTPLHYAALYGQREGVELLLRKRYVDIFAKNRFNNTPLHKAASTNNIAALTVFLDWVRILILDSFMYQYFFIDAENIYKETPLHIAAQKDNVEAVNLLLEKGANIHYKNRDGYTPLLCAVHANAAKATALLLDKEPSNTLEQRDHLDFTLLDHAAVRGAVDVIALLLDKGAQINSTDDGNGNTVLHNAVVHAKTASVKMLLKKEANVHSKNFIGKTPLQEAILAVRTQAASLLLDAGADIDSKNYSNTTILHSASSMGNAELVEFLLDRGADLEVQNKEGETALSIAYKNLNNADTKTREQAQKIIAIINNNAPYITISKRPATLVGLVVRCLLKKSQLATSSEPNDVHRYDYIQTAQQIAEKLHDNTGYNFLQALQAASTPTLQKQEAKIYLKSLIEHNQE